MLPFGDHLIVVDESSRLTVVDVENGEHYAEIHLGREFETTGICHPSTYLNKILLASKQVPDFSDKRGDDFSCFRAR
jgi:hypothetical protein